MLECTYCLKLNFSSSGQKKGIQAKLLPIEACTGLPWWIAQTHHWTLNGPPVRLVRSKTRLSIPCRTLSWGTGCTVSHASFQKKHSQEKGSFYEKYQSLVNECWNFCDLLMLNCIFHFHKMSLSNAWGYFSKWIHNMLVALILTFCFAEKLFAGKIWIKKRIVCFSYGLKLFDSLQGNICTFVQFQEIVEYNHLENALIWLIKRS